MESLTFPWPSNPVYRRHISIDFTIPELDAVKEGVAPERYYVPLSLLRKWPPLLRLDCRNGAGEPIPLLTRQQNGIVDSALLVALAESALAGSDFSVDDVRDSLIELATSKDRREASRALLSVVPPPKLGDTTPLQEKLAEDRVFTEIAGGLRDNTLLWLRVEGKPGDREIVKFAYDIPMRGRVQAWSPAAFGLRSFRLRFETPHLGTSGSYHLLISAPAPLVVADSEVLIREPLTPAGQPDQARIIGRCSARERECEEQVATGPLAMYTETFERDARFYVAGRRTGATGEARVAVMVEKGGFVKGAAIGAAGTAALLTAFAARLSEAVEETEATVTMLLVVPALLAYLLVRPNDHTLAAQMLRGLRRVLFGVGLLPLLGAAALVMAAGDASDLLCKTFVALAGAAWIATAITTAGAALPRGRFARPFSLRPAPSQKAPMEQ